ncbi:MAG: hypothetical protein U0W24_16515 [Bacteroidales bacterium]
MIKLKLLLVQLLLNCFFLSINAQSGHKFLDSYTFYKNQGNELSTTYFDAVGNPYYDSDFKNGIVFLKDTSYVKLQLRYNIYQYLIEYKNEGKIYNLSNTYNIDRITIGDTVFMYIPYINSRAIFEVLVGGKASLVKKSTVKLEPAKPPQPYVEASPPRFVRENDIYYIINGTAYFEIKNMESVYLALFDKKDNIKDYIKKERIKKRNKENLIKIVNYYNTLM